jgi:tripartite-type tricarboxylate transporter receptor subunit TctC
MKMKKSISVLLMVAVCVSLCISSVFAAFPERTITIICPWSPGGGTDLIGRFVAAKLEKKLGKPVVVTNRTGGSGAVGYGAAAHARPDGYTVLLCDVCVSTVSWLGISKVSYKDFEPVIQFNQDYAAVTVDAKAPWNSIDDLIKDIKKDPAKIIFSGSGAGTIWDLARIGLLDQKGINPKKVKWVPTGGAAPAITELLGGHVQVITCSYAEVAPQVEAGQLKTLAVMAPERQAAFPGISTLKEQGIDWVAATWRGFAVPKGTPKAVIAKLYQATKEVVTGTEFQKYMNKSGFGIAVTESKQFGAFMKEEYHRWGKIAKLGGYAK